MMTIRNKRLLRVALLVALLSYAGGFLAHAAVSAAQPTRRQTTALVSTSPYHSVMFVGDSVSVGWVNDGAHSFPVDTINDIYTHNSGNAWYQLVKARTGAQALGALVDLQQFGVHPAGVNLLVVELGTNDMAHLSAAQFQTNYQQLITYLLGGSPAAQLVCLGPWRAASDNFGFDAEPAYAAAIQTVCAQSSGGSALYIDLSATYADPATHNTTGDTFHPNDTGSAAIATLITNALYPPLGSGSGGVATVSAQGAARTMP